ncbi:MAG: DUF3500 domain-containing protein [Rhodospirillaceae bacterium]|jgi:hypothetical protein|nr:DUF3500 domain-containing protein [Rhodospirillaceae bacterium]
MSRIDYRKYVPTAETSKVHGESARQHAADLADVPLIKGILAGWQEMYAAPYTGMTTDGTVMPGLFKLRSEKAPIEQAIIAANHLISELTPEQLKSSSFDVDAKQWRNWQNTEIYFEDFGLRLAEVSDAVRDAILAVMRASLSAKGYEKSRNVMRLNGFLGDLVGGPEIFGEFTYLFSLFGTPSASEPWGWQIFGHHLCLSCLMIGDQMTITPTFMGGEPCSADEGPHKGLSIFDDEERFGLELMRSFSEDQQAKALIANSMIGGDLPEGRRVHHDGLHLGGAYCDNRIVPYEGLQGVDFTKLQRRNLLDLVAEYLGTLPPGPFAAKMEDVERHFADTHFCWIGSREEDQAFYYRIQSPVTLIEFDHHAGVFLTNPTPMNFHVHTLVRTPNGNDYGVDLIRQHYENAPHHKDHHHDH